MRKCIQGYIFIIILLLAECTYGSNLYIRMNQVGFLPGDIKTAVIFSEKPAADILFYIRETEYLEERYSGRIAQSELQTENFSYCYTAEFSSFTSPGSYVLEINGQKSHPFLISDDIFNSVTDSLLLFFKVQRCGPTKPYLHLPCHLSDATKVIGNGDSSAIDVTGGWHDAGDYIKFLSTTAYTTYMLLFSYEFDETKFNLDNDDNSVPDILEEARVGLDWLLRANYKKGKLITQVQDLRDHSAGWRMPEDDSLKFDRPAFTGVGKNQAGIYTAVMALAARIWIKRFYDYEFADKCLHAAKEIYSVRDEYPDINQSINGAYQDKEFEGKLALGGAELFITTSDSTYLFDAAAYASSAKPDFWWSWGNINALAYYRLSWFLPDFITNLQSSLELFNQEKEKSLFNEGTSYTWGTTNAFLGITLQAILFKKITGNNKFDSLAVYQRDFVLGRNRWGVSFISKTGTVYPHNLHSQVFYLNGGYLPGALAAGPAPTDVLNNYKIERDSTKYNMFNTSTTAYYDDTNDYITNEPTITSNATALFVFGNYSSRIKE